MTPLKKILKPWYKNTLVFLKDWKYFSSIKIDEVDKDTKVYEILFYIIKRKAKVPILDISWLKEWKILKILKWFTCLTSREYGKNN